jgi:hypothetical protein
MYGILIGIGIFIGASNYKPSTTPTTDWILTSGSWDDTKHWNDSQTWKDN